MKLRGAGSNIAGRFARLARDPFDDGWPRELAPPPALPTQVTEERARSILTTNDSPDVPFERSVNPYRGCEHGCVYCLGPETRILLADGSLRAIADLREGDAIYGTERSGKRLVYKPTRVIAHWSVLRPAWLVTLADGTRLTCGPEHRFLTERGWKFVADATAGENRRPKLSPDDSLIGTSAFPNPLEARVKVVSVEPLGKAMRLFDITTGSGDFIAEGVVSHNCYARPSHAYLELSPGLDFETKLFAKTNAVQLLRAALSRPGYEAKPIAFGTNTDCYQPLERRYRIMRAILELFAECHHPLTITTKSALVERDLDLLGPMAARNLVTVFVSITTLDEALARRLEPRAASPRRRLDTIRALARAGVPCGVMVAPLIPALTDRSLEAILQAAAQAGATMAGWTMLRLPNEVRPIFKDWLATQFPERAAHVTSLIRQVRGGGENDPRFGARMSGSGTFARLIERRFDLACRKFGLNADGTGARGELDCTLFRPPQGGAQMKLF